MEKIPPTYSDIMNMELHQIVEVFEPPYFRIMKVPTGWLYNFYVSESDTYSTNWVFVPHVN